MHGDEITRLIRVERGIGDLMRRLNALDVNAGQVDQQIREAWTVLPTKGCTTTITTTVTSGGVPQSGVTVTVKLGATTIGTCSTSGSGQCTVTVSAAGTYTVSAALSCASASTSVVVGTLCVDYPASLALTSTGVLTITAAGCVGTALDGATVTLSGGMTASGTTNSSGVATFSYASPPGSVTYTISKARFTTQASSVNITGCGASGGLTLAVAAGYQCTGSGCADPWPTTLNLTDSTLGAATLTYTSGAWIACVTRTVTGSDCAGHSASYTIPVKYTFTGTNALGVHRGTIRVEYSACSAGAFQPTGNFTSIFDGLPPSCSNGPPWGSGGGVDRTGTVNGSGVMSCALPGSVTMTVPAAAAPGSIYGTSSNNITVSE